MATRRRTAARRRTTRRRRQTTPFVISGRFVREGLALVLLFLAILSVIALFAPTAGAIVQPWHDLLASMLGWGIAFAAPLLAGFAVMLWMKTMPAERWMAATGAAVFALALLGMFDLVGGGVEGEGGGYLGGSVASVLTTALGAAGAWVARRTAVKLSEKDSSQAASGASHAIGRDPPALLIRMSTRP